MENLTEDKKYLVDGFLYPTKEAKTFFQVDLFNKLSEILPLQILYCEENLIAEVREQNLWHCIEIIGNFLMENTEYKETLKQMYEEENLLGLVRLSLINFVYVYSQKNDEYKDVNFTKVPECILFV